MLIWFALVALRSFIDKIKKKKKKKIQRLLTHATLA
jgi:hypothetical protein